jgi:hypothetical protein
LKDCLHFKHIRFCAQWTVPSEGWAKSVQQAGQRIATRRAPATCCSRQSNNHPSGAVVPNLLCKRRQQQCDVQESTSIMSAASRVVHRRRQHICSCSPIATLQRYACRMLARLLVQRYCTLPHLIDQCNVCVCSRATLGSQQRPVRCWSEAMPCRLGTHPRTALFCQAT